MGRRKIKIQRIEDERLRQVTFQKRKKGLLKKAMELSLLTGINVMMTLYDSIDQRIIQYRSDSIETFKNIKQDSISNQEIYLNNDYFKQFNEDDDKEESKDHKQSKNKTKQKQKQDSKNSKIEKLDLDKNIYINEQINLYKKQETPNNQKEQEIERNEKINQLIKNMKNIPQQIDLIQRNKQLDEQLLKDTPSQINFKEPEKPLFNQSLTPQYIQQLLMSRNLSQLSGVGNNSNSDIRTPSFTNLQQQLIENPNLFNEQSFGRSISDPKFGQEKDDPKKQNSNSGEKNQITTIDKGSLNHTFSNELLSVNQQTIDAYGIKNPYLISNQNSEQQPQTFIAQTLNSQQSNGNQQLLILQPINTQIFGLTTNNLQQNKNQTRQQSQYQQTSPTIQEKVDKINKFDRENKDFQNKKENSAFSQVNNQQNICNKKDQKPINIIECQKQQEKRNSNDEDLNPNQRFHSDFFIKKVDEFEHVSRQGSDYFYGIKINNQQSNQNIQSQNNKDQVDSSNKINQYINQMNESNLVSNSINDELNLKNIQFQNQLQQNQRQYLNLNSQNYKREALKSQSNDELFKSNSNTSKSNQFEQLMNNILLENNSMQMNLDQQNNKNLLENDQNRSILQGQGHSDKSYVNQQLETFYQQNQYPLIVATGNQSGTGNTQPNQVYLLQPKRSNMKYQQNLSNFKEDQDMN